MISWRQDQCNIVVVHAKIPAVDYQTWKLVCVYVLQWKYVVNMNYGEPINATGKHNCCYFPD